MTTRGSIGYTVASVLLTLAFGLVGWLLLPMAPGEVAVLTILYAAGWHIISLPRTKATRLGWLHAAPYVSLVSLIAIIGLTVLGMGPPGDATPTRVIGFVAALVCLPMIFAWPAAWVWLIFTRRRQEIAHAI